MGKKVTKYIIVATTLVNLGLIIIVSASIRGLVRVYTGYIISFSMLVRGFITLKLVFILLRKHGGEVD